MIPHFKNSVICNGVCIVSGDWWTKLSNKTVGFQNTKITQQSNLEEKEIRNGNEGNINKPNAPDERSINDEDLLSP